MNFESDVGARFLQRFAREFDLDCGACCPELRLVLDLSFDSLDLMRVGLLLDAFAPLWEVPREVEVSELTVGDLVDFVRTGRSAVPGT